jgi:hypothetical protein
LYDSWAKHTGTDPLTISRESVARGESLFNTLPIPITGVKPPHIAIHVRHVIVEQH